MAEKTKLYCVFLFLFPLRENCIRNVCVFVMWLHTNNEKHFYAINITYRASCLKHWNRLNEIFMWHDNNRNSMNICVIKIDHVYIGRAQTIGVWEPVTKHFTIIIGSNSLAANAMSGHKKLFKNWTAFEVIQVLKYRIQFI